MYELETLAALNQIRAESYSGTEQFLEMLIRQGLVSRDESGALTLTDKGQSRLPNN